MFLRYFVLLLCLFSFSFGETFKEVLQKAYEKSPYLKAFEYQVKSFDGQILQAKRTFNPQMQVEFGRLISQTESGFALTSFSVSQQLRLWGEKDFAVKSATLRKKAQEYFYQQQKNILAGQVYQTFYEILYLQRLIDIRQKQLKTLENLYTFIKKKYQLGDALIIDVLRAEKDISIVKVNIENLKAKKLAKENFLKAITGVDVKSYEGNLLNFPKVSNINVENLPFIRYYELLAKSYDTQIKRQKALAKPQVSVGFVAGEDEADLGKYEFGLSMSATLPVFYKNQGQIIRFVNLKNQALENKKRYILQYQNQINAIEKQINVLKEQLKNLEENAIKKLGQTLKIAEKGYKEGTITFLELSNIRNQYFDTATFKENLIFQIHSLYGEYIKIGGLR